MLLPDGHVVTGKTGDLLGAASSLLMNALKTVTGVDLELPVIHDAAIEPICRLKTEHLNSANRRLHSDETLIALSITSATDPVATRVIDGLEQLHGATPSSPLSSHPRTRRCIANSASTCAANRSTNG